MAQTFFKYPHFVHTSTLAVCMVIGLAGMSVRAGTTRTTDESARTKAAVSAVDHHWMMANANGNTQWINAMVLPEYLSVRGDGSVMTKTMLLDYVTAHHASSVAEREAKARKIRAFLKAHRESVVMHGNVAVVSYYQSKPGSEDKLDSSDIYLYENGHWHALYSRG